MSFVYSMRNLRDQILKMEKYKSRGKVFLFKNVTHFKIKSILNLFIEEIAISINEFLQYDLFFGLSFLKRKRNS